MNLIVLILSASISRLFLTPCLGMSFYTQRTERLCDVPIRDCADAAHLAWSHYCLIVKNEPLLWLEGDSAIRSLQPKIGQPCQNIAIACNSSHKSSIYLPIKGLNSQTLETLASMLNVEVFVGSVDLKKPLIETLTLMLYICNFII